jgi:hypothetical protein
MKRALLALALLALITPACGDDPAAPTFPRDPRATYRAKTWNGGKFPVLLADDSTWVGGVRRPAKHYAAGLWLRIGTPQYMVTIEEYWVLHGTNEVVNHLPNSVVDAGQ